MHFMSGRLHRLILPLLVSLFCLGGCATNNPRDPLEPMNRVIYRFNDSVDTVLIRPVAEAYRFVVPSFVRTGISNFFANINDVLVALNSLLQGKVVNALSDVTRVVINTTIGIGGLFDVASPMGLEKHNEDFGQTLGFWGIGDGPYLMLPLLGPSSLRDAVGTFIGTKIDPVGFVNSMRLRNSLWGTRLMNTRSELLDTSRILETASLDPYEFLRDAYLQRRRNLVYDGVPPREKFDDDDEPPAKPRAPAPDAKPPATAPGATLLTPVAPEEPAAAATPDAEPAAASPAAATPDTATPAAHNIGAPEAEREATLPAAPNAAGAPAA
jgi:phospholipid-binding lipoprotein MlaA